LDQSRKWSKTLQPKSEKGRNVTTKKVRMAAQVPNVSKKVEEVSDQYKSAKLWIDLAKLHRHDFSHFDIGVKGDIH
jgi:hypothetical protein